MPYYTTADGARLYYRLEGQPQAQQPALLFIHGWCSNLRHWDHQARHFRRHFQVLRLDRRGLGRSTTPGTGHNAEQHAADIAAVAKAAGIKRVIAIGHAGGAPVTMALARRFPRLVKAMVIVDAAMYPKPRLDDPRSVFGAVLGPMLEALSAPGGKAALKKMYSGYFAPQCDKAVSSAAVADALQTPLPIAVQELRMMMVSTQKIADDINQPTLWLTAAPVDQQYIASHLRNVQFGQVVGAGHFPQLEVPAQTNAMLQTFIQQLR
ncbi:MAG: alpha/beta hydrolase [Pseudomonadota bacterium]